MNIVLMAAMMAGMMLLFHGRGHRSHSGGQKPPAADAKPPAPQPAPQSTPQQPPSDHGSTPVETHPPEPMPPVPDPH